MTRLNYKALLLVVITIGFSLRFAFIDDGLPFRYDVDEVHRMAIVMHMLSEKTLNPGWFGHPAQTVIYLLALVIGIFYFIANTFGAFSSPADFAAWYHADPTVLFMMGRFIIILSSIALIAVTALIGRRVYNARVALLAGFILAISPLHVYHSSLIRSSDIVMSLFMMLCLFFALKIYADKRSEIVQYPELSWAVTKPYLLAGLFLGLAVTSKFYGVFAASSIVAAHFMNKHSLKNSVMLLLLAMLASLFGAFISGPFMFLDFGTMIDDVFGEARETHLSATAPGFWVDILWFTQVLIKEGVGVVLFLFAVLGIALSCRARRNELIILLVSPVLLITFLAALSLRWDRWVLSLIPFLALFAAAFLDECFNKISNFSTQPIRLAAYLAVLILAIYSPANAALTEIKDLEKPDARDIAFKWICDHVKSGSGIFVEMHGPQLDRNSYRIVKVGNDHRLRIIDSNSDGFNNVVPHGYYSNVSSLDDLSANGVDYVVLSSLEDRMKASRFPGLYKKELTKYQELFQSSELLFDTSAIPYIRGPRIEVYKINVLHNRSSGS